MAEAHHGAHDDLVLITGPRLALLRHALVRVSARARFRARVRLRARVRVRVSLAAPRLG